MVVWYARQSSAQIVTGQVIEASDFNDEFNAIVIAIASLTAGAGGHNHTGTNGQGPLLDISGSASSAVPFVGVLGPQFGGIHYVGTLPAVTDDTPDFVPGSRWINSGTGDVWTCTDNSTGAAVWLKETANVAAADPTTTSDLAHGYAAGSTWYNSSTKAVFICKDSTNSAAVWARLTGVSSASLPTVNDDIDSWYIIGSIWNYTGVSPALQLICVDNTNGAAVWVPIARGRVGVISGATTLPVTTDDTAHGYERGSIIINSTTSVAFVCVDATNSAAVWHPLATGRTNATASAPGVNDDTADGYTVGSVWVDTSANRVYVALDVSAGAAVWTTFSTANAYTVKTTAYSIQDGDRILADTSGTTAILFTAPSAVNDGIQFSIADYAQTWDTAEARITGSFTGVTGTFELNTKGAALAFVSSNSLFRIV